MCLFQDLALYALATKIFKNNRYVFQSLALYALTIKLFIFCMCLFQDLALYALAMKLFKNNGLCFPEPRTLRTNHQIVNILYVSI